MRMRSFLAAALVAAVAVVSCREGRDGLPEWAIGPFSRPVSSPVITPDAGPYFDCPMLGDRVRWAEGATFNPAATLYDGRIAVLFRSEDDLNQGIGTRTSRLGLAWSDDGVTMLPEPAPVLFPAEDAQGSRCNV